MAADGIDLCVILQNADFFYFTGTVQKGTLIVPLDGEPILFIQRSLDRAREETPLEITGISSDKEIGNLLKESRDFPRQNRYRIRCAARGPF